MVRNVVKSVAEAYCDTVVKKYRQLRGTTQEISQILSQAYQLCGINYHGACSGQTGDGCG